MKHIKFGVVGLGRLGYVHALNVHANHRVELTAVCDQDTERAAAVGDKLGVKWFGNIEEMLPHVDAVCVVTPTNFHVEPITAVANAGKWLFCEKPLAGNLDDSRRLVELIDNAGIPCQMGFQRRFDSDFSEAAQLIASGEIGTPTHVISVSRDPFPPPPWARDPATGGGLFIDMLLHDFDTLRFLLSQEVETVFAEEANLVVDGQGIDRFADNATCSLRFSEGALAQCHASMHAEYGYDVRAEVFGEHGMLQIGAIAQNGLTRFTAGAGVSRPGTYLGERDLPHFMQRFSGAYANEIEAFIDCIVEDTSPSVTHHDAHKAFEIALAASESAGSGRPVRPGHST